MKRIQTNDYQNPSKIIGIQFSMLSPEEIRKNSGKMSTLAYDNPRTSFKETGAQRVWPSQQCPRGRGHEGLGWTCAPSHRSLTVVFGFILLPHTDKPINQRDFIILVSLS